MNINSRYRFLKQTFLFGLAAWVATTAGAESNEWKRIAIAGTQLETSSIQVLGRNGISARCHPEGMDTIPSFSALATSHLCAGRPTLAAGSRVQLLDVFKRNGKYAAKVKVSRTSKNSSGYAQEGDEQWVYLNPNSPFLQIFNDRTGSVHDLGEYLQRAENNEAINIPGFEEPQTSDAALEAYLQQNPNENLNTSHSDPDVISNQSDIPTAGEYQSPPPGVHVEPPGPIDEVTEVEGTLTAQANLCQMPVEAERIDDRYCPHRPTQWINGRERSCPDRNPSNMARHANGQLQNWLIDLVQTASAEVSGTTADQSTCASPALMLSLLDQESTFHPMAGGNQWGDHGIAQFQLGTAQSTLTYLQQVAPPNSPMHTVVNKGLMWVPPGCSKTSTPWSTSLSSSCLASIERNCMENGRMVASLYCPQFAIRLQAYHMKQICEERVMINGVNVSQVLQGNGNPVAQARFLVSRYNRGYRIYNSAAHYFEVHGRFPTAHEYGQLWGTRRPTAYAHRSADPYAGGNLLGHTINRCYNWRIAGLCGGMQGTIFHHYLGMSCSSSSTTSPNSATEVSQ